MKLNSKQKKNQQKSSPHPQKLQLLVGTERMYIKLCAMNLKLRVQTKKREERKKERVVYKIQLVEWQVRYAFRVAYLEETKKGRIKSWNSVKRLKSGYQFPSPLFATSLGPYKNSTEFLISAVPPCGTLQIIIFHTSV